ncbi:DUF3592 domain-containing protein [Pirellulimonas nuda]|uniref:DUF3592 domain-containing protein n=1 Tax=Pirellulimonas nuda TaxID=2528009 RepID=UPI0018D467F1|nr:DUF3592 domain-containing protein [Pirellulimonas nuda]
MLTLIGVALLWVAATPVWQWLRVLDWVETPAVLRSVSTVEERGENSTWRRVVASYEYEWDGQQYTGTRVLLPTLKGPFDRRDRRKSVELEGVKQAGGATVCYVNPRSPSEAVLDRSLRVEDLAMGLSFLMIGAGARLVFTYHSRKWQAGIDPALQEKHPGEPWLWNADWRSGRLRSERRFNLGELFGGGLAIGGFTAAFLCIRAFGDSESNLLFWVTAVFCLLSALFAYGILMSLLRWARFGDAVFRMAGPSGVVGGKLVGEVLGPRSLLDADEGTLRLFCTKTTIRKDRETRERDEVSWECELTVTPKRDAGRVVLPVDFTIPSSAESTSRSEDRLVTWRLMARAKLAGPDFAESFVVPVFLTEDSQDGVVVEEPPEPDAFDETSTLDEILVAEGIRVDPLGGSAVRYVAPAGRSRGYAWSTTLWALGWNGVLGGIGYAIYTHADWGATLFWIVAAIACWILLLFGPLLVVAALDGWLHSEELTIDDERWTTRIGWWGLPKWRTEFLAGNIRRIVVKHSKGGSVRVGNGPEKKSPGANDLFAEVAGAKLPRTLLRRVKSRRGSALLGEEIRRRAGVEEPLVTVDEFAELKAKLQERREEGG